MKKSKCIVALAAVLSMLAVPFSNAIAAENEDYQPSIYFKAIETKEARQLKNKTMYINTSLLNDENNSFNAEVYVSDENKLIGHLIAKWKCESEYIALTGLKDPITLCGTSPYSNFQTAKSIETTEHPELNRQYVSYALGLHSDPFDLTGENSDDYPIAGFTAVVNNQTPAGRYAIEFMSGESGAQCELLYKYRNSSSIKENFPAGDYAKPLKINVSDRMLGDIDNDGIITGSDATRILSAYTSLSSNGGSGLTTAEEIAADIDADGMITGSDATLLLRYYTSISSNDTRDIYTYLAEETN